MSFPETLEFKNYYVEKQYMVANVETGVLTNRSGRRMLALTNDFLIGLHRALESECGERAGEVLYRCGKKWGKNFGKGLTAEWSRFLRMQLHGVSARVRTNAARTGIRLQRLGNSRHRLSAPPSRCPRLDLRRRHHVGHHHNGC